MKVKFIGYGGIPEKKWFRVIEIMNYEWGVVINVDNHHRHIPWGEFVVPFMYDPRHMVFDKEAKEELKLLLMA